MKREDIILTVAGSLASIVVAYLVYQHQQAQAQIAAQNSAENDAEIESELANQQAESAALPQISVPSISSTPSATDVTQQSTGSDASDSVLESIISAFQATDNSNITNAMTPIATVGLMTTPMLPIVSQPVAVTSQQPVATAPTQPIATQPVAGTASPILTPGSGVTIPSTLPSSISS